MVKAEENSFGLIIDEVRDTADIVVKPINRLLKSLKVYSGATILGDGSVALILDVLGISKVAQVGVERAKKQDFEAGAVEKGRKTNERQDFLLVKLNSPAKHAIVMGYVHRLEEFKSSQIEYSGNQPVIRYRNSILPLLCASELLGYGRSSERNETLPVVVIQRAGALFGIEVDAILDTLSTTAETDSGHVKQVGIFGSMDVGEELVVVMDPFELIGKAYPDLNPDQRPRAPVEPPRAPTMGAAKLRILLAEDTLFFRKTIKKVLEGAGYEVTTANDGQEAIDILNRTETPFDLIVSDIEMPNVNGFELAASVRKHTQHSSMPLLALSSRADKEYMLEGQRVGFDIYLEKLKPATLLAAAAELTSKRRGAA